ncbi:hypothetical protein FACS1894110_19060 [Spirochaetia bacterium]|nr:hypothetical protein FACS1894110_19060 [Spirochaetia bacterium]
MIPSKLTFPDEYGNPHEDELYLDNYLQSFNNLINKTNYSVYSLTGAWGSGKTSFIKMWEKDNLKDFQYIHIDAFEMDYLTDPFIMFIKHFNDYLKIKKIESDVAKDFITKAKKIAKIGGKFIVKGTVGFIAERTIGKENIKEILSELSENVFDELIETTEPVSELYKQLRDSINKILEKSDETLFIIIDELDRCRPSFALEVIEKIKHIFILPKIKFILIMNEKVLESMIEKEYNLRGEGHRYLQKFIQKRIPYEPKADLYQYLSKTLVDDKEFFHGAARSQIQTCLDLGILTNLPTQFGLSLRDFTIIFSNLKMYHNYSSTESLIIFALEILKLIDNENYNNLENHIVLNDNLPVENQNIKLLQTIITFLKCSAKPEEINNCVVKYFHHEYY